MACRTGCKTQDHASWGECARAASLQVNALVESAAKDDYRQTKTDLKLYAEARREGVQPESTRERDVKRAMAVSKAMKTPYNAEVMPPASMIVNKNAARFVKSSVED